MKALFLSWQPWAVLSAIFAALTALFAKVGVEGINSNFATFIRTFVVFLALAVLLRVTGEFQPLSSVTRKTWVFLVLSGLATGASWLSYFHAIKLGPVSQVAPIDKLSIVLVAVMAVLLLGEKLSLLSWPGIGLMVTGSILLLVKR